MARWTNCNLLHFAPDAKRIWQFDAKGRNFVLGREMSVPYAETLPTKSIAKNWSSLWAPKLNLAWLPPEDVFLRVIELPVSSVEETASMVELQLEKLSPMPLTQIVWAMHLFPRAQQTETDNLQTVVVVIVARQVVDSFLTKLEAEGFQADQLEVAMLDQLEAVVPKEDGVWVFPQPIGGQNAAILAFWTGGVLRNLSIITLPAAGDQAKEVKDQIEHILWSGELEGWLTGALRWHVVADAAVATEWENALRGGLNETVQVEAPPTTVDLAGRTAKRSAAAPKTNLLPPEFSTRYRQQFVDRLWLRGLFYAGLAYMAGVAVYFCFVAFMAYQTSAVESQVTALSGSYTNALQLRARYDVLKERNDLKFAALDCWRLLAEKLPDGMTIQRFSFADGQTLSLSGTVPSQDISKILVFEKDLRKGQLDGRTIFNPVSKPTDQVSWNQHGDSDYWRFGLELAQSAEDAK